MNILSISTPSKIISVALVEINSDDFNTSSILAEQSIRDAKSEDVVKFLDDILSNANFEINKVDLVTVAIGPGSYSGLRGGLAAAKSLSQFLNKPIIGVSTLLAMAYEAINFDGVVAVILDAVKDEYNFALFSVYQNKLQRLTDDMVLTSEKVKKFLLEFKSTFYIVSSFDAKKIFSVIDAKNIISFCSAKTVAFAGYQKYLEGKVDDCKTLVPNYSHKPNLREFRL